MKRLELATAPFLREGSTTRGMMWEVFAATVPVLGWALWRFGVGALLIVAACCLGAVLTEWILGPRRGLGNLVDGSALLTGVLLGLTLPPALPLWMAALGGAVAIALGKAVWGGLGQNLFNPALVGRAFLQAAFPVTMTTWTAPVSDWLATPSSLWAAPLMRSSADLVTTATPLGLRKFEGQGTALAELAFGQSAGSLGETPALLLLAIGIWLGVRRIFDPRLFAATLLSVALFAGLFHLLSPEQNPGPLFMLSSGGLLFGAVFMVTDPVTSPVTPKGAWIFGAGVGFLVVLLRLYGGLPEAVMYSILLMNAATPLINRGTQPRRFGAR